MANVIYRDGPAVKTWKKFAQHVRSRGCNLLKGLPRYHDPVLITGCQRSGTTILSRVITQSQGMIDYRFGHDDELDAALILSKYVDYDIRNGRYCFQTTYLNECYTEYFEHEESYKIIWVLRNPYSVVYSMTHNWKRFALNELFKSCGASLLSNEAKKRYDRFGPIAISRIYKACMAFNGKVLQLNELVTKLGENRIMVVEYDNLVTSTEQTLKGIYEFIDLEYNAEYARKIHAASLKKMNKLSKRELSMIKQYCMPVYDEARNYMTNI